MIYTSYFGNIKNLQSRPGLEFISIAGKTPDWFTGAKLSLLAPKHDWWKEWHEKFADDLGSKESVAWYSDKYWKTVLRDLDPLETAQLIKDTVGWNMPVLLCYETPEKFCHRHLVRKWLNDHRIECKEIE